MDDDLAIDQAAGIPFARALYDLALEFGDRSQDVEASLIEEFSARAAGLAPEIGAITINHDDDERLTLAADGTLRGEVLDEATGTWRELRSPEDVVAYYDPTDIFFDLADALAEAYPAIEVDGDGGVLDETIAHDGATGHDVEPADSNLPMSDGEPDRSQTERVGSSTLASLENLRRAGALSEEEFQRLRTQLGV